MYIIPYPVGGEALSVHYKKTKLELIIMILPSLIGFSIFFVFPFFVCLYYSVIENPVSGGFVGIKNYLKVFENKSFLLSVKNTVFFTGIVVPLNMALSLALAIVLHRKIPIRKTLRTSFILPLVIPTVSVALVWKNIFDIQGPLNQILMSMNLITRQIDFLESNFAFYIAVTLFLWKNTGYCFILFSAGLANIPLEYYDYIKLESKSNFAVFKHITIVYLAPTTFFVFIISIINSFKVFRDLYLISGNYPHESIYMLQNFINNSFKGLDYGKLTSSAVIVAVVVYTLVLVLYKTERKIGNDL